MNASQLKYHLIAAVAAVIGGLSVSAEVALPADYTRLEWVRATGTQFVNALYFLKQSDVIEARMQVDAVQPYLNSTLFGASGNKSGTEASPYYYVGAAWSQQGRYRYKRNGTSVGGTNTAFYDQPIDIRCDGMSMTWKPVGEEAWTETLTVGGMDGDCTANLIVFAMNKGGTPDGYSSGRLYSFDVTSATGAKIRSFVPCRNASGQAGLWDVVEGVFHECGGTGRLYGSDEPAPDGDVRLSSITFTGSQYINTKYAYKAYDVFELDCLANATGQKDYTTFFGSRGNDNTDHAALVFATLGANAYRTKMFRSGQSYDDDSNAHGFPYGQRVTLTATEDALAWTPADGSEGNGYTLPAQSKHEGGDSNKPVLVFAVWKNGATAIDANSYLAGKFYSFKVTDSDGVVQRNLVPYRKADGTLCVCDVANGNTIYSISGGGVLAGAAVSDEDGVRTFYDGKINADDLRGFTGFAKDSPYLLNAADVTAFPGDLTLKQGMISFADGVAATCAVNGTLTLSGGARIELDVLPDGNDRLAPTAVAVEATAENPAKISLSFNGVGALEEPRTLIAGGVAAADLAKIKVTSALPVRLRVTDSGALVVEPKTVGEFAWTGAAQDGGLWTTAANWEDGELPEDGGKLVFGLAAGGATQLDGPSGLSVERVTATATAGAFTHGGGALGVTQALVNESSAEQTFLMAMTLGLPAQSFTFATAGGLTLTNGIQTAGASEYVKTGAGTLALNDEVVAAAEKVTVSEGTLRLNYTGRVKAAATAGEIRIQNGACLDVNCDAGNAASLARTEVTHGKTVYVEGAGPGNLGAIVNSNPNYTWGCTFGHLVLTGDATAGGAGNLSIRPLANSRIGGSKLEGPGTLYANGEWQFNFNATTFAVGGIVVGSGSYVQFETSASGTVTNGVTLADGSRFRLLGISTVPATIPMTVPSDTSSRIEIAESTSTLKGVLHVDGRLTLSNYTSSVSLKLAGTLAGKGALAGDGLAFSGTASRWEMKADDSGFTEKIDISGMRGIAPMLASVKTIAVTYTGDATAAHRFAIAPAGDLTQAQASAITLEVKDADGETVPDCVLSVVDRTLCLETASRRVETAVWTGGGDTANLFDPANWDCMNGTTKVEGGLPMSETHVVIPNGSVFNCPPGAGFAFADIELPDTLEADTDWRGLGTGLALPDWLNLNGHRLYVSSLGSSGVIYDLTGYELLESVSSTGSKYLDTGYKLKATDIVDTRLTAANNSNSAILFGASDKDDSSHLYYVGSGWNANGKYRYKRNGTSVGNTLATFYNQPIVIHCDGVNMSWKPAADDVWKETLTVGGTSGDCAYSLYLFANNGAGTMNCPCTATFYSFKITSAEGRVMRDFVPARRMSDGAVGMLDLSLGDLTRDPFCAGSGALDGGTVLKEASGAGGEVHIDVPADGTVNNTGVTILGSVTLVKEGEGAYVPNFASGQVYSGETIISNGTMKARCDQYANSAKVTIAHDAVLDINGANKTVCVRPAKAFVLAGGTMANLAADCTDDMTCFGDVTLADDSFADATRTFGFVGANYAATRLDLAGHELEIAIASGKSFWLYNTEVTAGKLTATGDGRLVLNKTSVRAGAADFDLACGLSIQVNSTVSNLTLRGASAATVASGKSLTVKGSFTPIGNANATGIKMADDSTIDLSQAVFEGPLNGLSYASGATVTIDLGTRRVKNGTKLLNWTTPPDGVTFKTKEGVSCGLQCKPDGLYLIKGFIILIADHAAPRPAWRSERT